MKLNEYNLLDVRLNLFDGNLNTNTTGTETLSVENKTYYDKLLIQTAEPELVHEQHGQKRPIPKHGGKTIEFRRFDSLGELNTPLTEGVTPDGQTLKATSMTAELHQYGGYVALSDQLDLTALDPVTVEATKAVASQAGRTRDGVIRDVMNSGTNVQYADGKVASRAALSYTDKDNNCNLTVAAVKRAVRELERQSAPRIDGFYVGIVHPDCKMDIMNDPEWRAPHEYVDTEHLYRGEIGEIAGVRFVVSPRAKVFKGEGASGADVYSTLIYGENAYGVTDLEGAGMEHIVKPLGSGGTADPLNQRATVGWKGTFTAKILIEQYMVRVETTATP